jgi:hypothetical protein
MFTTAFLGLWATWVSPAVCDAATMATSFDLRHAPGHVAAHNVTAAPFAAERTRRGDRAAADSRRPIVRAFASFVHEWADNGSPSPTTYVAITNRATYPKPPVPALGPAGYSFTDPTFGSRMLRVTDGNTRPGLPNRSYRVSSNAHLATWNATSTGFYVISNDGTVIPYSFDAATMTARRIGATGSGDGGLTLAFYVEPHFSMTNPNLIYGVSSRTNNRTIMKYDFTTGVYTTVLDLDSVVGGLANTYVGGMMTAGSPENLMAFFGGQSQDAHFYALFAPLGKPGAAKILNSVTSTINGRSTNVALNFHLHSASIDRSGRYIFLYPTGGDLGAPRDAAQVYLWDTQTDHITPLGVSARSGGHDAYGFGYSVNQDCCTSSSWDGTQWQFRYLANPTGTNDLISPVLTPREIYIDDHTSWNNARPDAMVPVISSTFRYYGSNNTTPWRAWDDEIIAIDTTNGIGGTVWRFAHHRSNTSSDNDPASLYFWYEPIASVSPDGRWVMFTSNWEKTLGRDAAEGTYRQDVFIVQLLAPGGPAAPSSGAAAVAPWLLTTAVAGSTVTLDWQPTGGVNAASFAIEAGSAPGLTDLARIDVASTHFVAYGVSPGVYYVRVRAAGAVSNEAIVTVGGFNTSSASQPGGTSGLIASVSGADVTLRWNAASYASGYILEAGSAPGLSDLAYVQTGSSDTSFFAPNVSPGVYYVRVRGANSSGAGAASNEVVVAVR